MGPADDEVDGMYVAAGATARWRSVCSYSVPWVVRVATNSALGELRRYIADLSEGDVAEALGCTTGTIKTHTKRDLAAMRRHLALEEEP